MLQSPFLLILAITRTLMILANQIRYTVKNNLSLIKFISFALVEFGFRLVLPFAIVYILVARCMERDLTVKVFMGIFLLLVLVLLLA